MQNVEKMQIVRQYMTNSLKKGDKKNPSKTSSRYRSIVLKISCSHPGHIVCPFHVLSFHPIESAGPVCLPASSKIKKNLCLC